MGIALAHLKIQKDYLEHRVKDLENRNKVLSSAYQSKKVELIKIKEK
jgi:hypothetical protein